MGMKIRWSESAVEQYAERLEYIGGFSPDAARALQRHVQKSLRHLSEYPDLGRWVPEFGVGVCREILVKPLRIQYGNHGDVLVVLHVFRQEENIGPDTWPDEGH